MTIVGGLDIHRGQFTFEVGDDKTGELRRGRLRQPGRERFRRWLEQFDGEGVHLAVEGCTGWRAVVEEIQAAGFMAHLADPAETSTARGPKSRAKSDRTDAGLLRRQLLRGELAESWIPPTHVLEWRDRLRLYRILRDQRAEWQQRIHAVLYHQGVPKPAAGVTSPESRAWLLGEAELSPAGRERVRMAFAVIDFYAAQMVPLRRRIDRHARRQPACRALAETHYGLAEVTSSVVWAELGDCRRFANSSQAVRHAGLDITVWSSDRHRSAGHLARQGPETLRWALYEAAKCAARGGPDHDYYQSVKTRLGGKRAALSVARKLVRRCHHQLRELGDKVLDEVPDTEIT
jgi:transposase